MALLGSLLSRSPWASAVTKQSPHTQQDVRAKSLQSCLILCDPVDCSPPPGPLCPRGSPGKNTGARCHALLQGIFPTQGSNPCLMSLALAGRLFTTSATWEATLNRTGGGYLLLNNSSLDLLACAADSRTRLDSITDSSS